MPIFNEQAFLAAVDANQDLSWLRPGHFADWPGLAKALERLSPEQRCDAIYADWLLQLNSPARQALLQVRNLLTKKDAIAANCLTELAHIAKDAFSGQRTQLRAVKVKANRIPTPATPELGFSDHEITASSSCQLHPPPPH